MHANAMACVQYGKLEGHFLSTGRPVEKDYMSIKSIKSRDPVVEQSGLTTAYMDQVLLKPMAGSWESVWPKSARGLAKVIACAWPESLLGAVSVQLGNQGA